MKGKVKRMLSGLLSVVTILSSCIQPLAAYAAEPEPAPYETEFPALRKVIDMLEADEVVTASDYEVEIGSIDVECDFTGLDINPEKVKVTFHEAKNERGQDFDINQAGTYNAVYFIQPVSGPAYHISRKIIVKEPVLETQSEKTEQESESHTDQTEESENDEGESDSYQEGISEEIPSTDKPVDKAETETREKENLEEEPEAVEIADGEGLLLFAANTNSRASGTATMVKGRKIYYPSNLGNYFTCYFTVNGKIAYCLESAKASPDTGDYASSVLEGNPNLQKAIYYGYGGAGDVSGTYMPDFDEDLKYVFTHIAASYFYCGIDGFAGCTMDDLRECGVLGWIDYLASLPAPPDPFLNLSKSELKASYDGSGQTTGTIKLNGDSRNGITLKIPKDVTYHNKSTGSSQTGGTVRIAGGTSFYFTAPVTVNGEWKTGDLRGSIRNIWKALVVSTGDYTQDIGSYYEEDSGNSVSFSVDWLELTKVKVSKVDSKNPDVKLSGAVFGIYKDKACTQLITKMPATDNNGASTAEIVMTQDTVYLKEITAPKGYRLNTTAYNVKLVANQTTSVTVPDVEQLGELTVYKEGQVLCGADVTDTVTIFRYENRRQAGAIYEVYAGEDVFTAYGALMYKKGDLVKGSLTTDSNGAVILKNLHLGTYVIKEVQAPENFYNPAEEKTVTLSYAGQNVETVFSETTYTNDRQKAKVSVIKKDKDTLNPLEGGIFGLYADSDITSNDGNVVVKKGTLIEKAATGEDGTAVFTADLPIGFSYSVKEEQAPEGYLRNTGDIYSFKFSYTNDEEAEVTFTHTFVNERVNAKISIQKKDAETNESVAQGDATLEKAVYGLYAREDIVHPDGVTGVLYKAGEKVASLTTDENGGAVIGNLYLGSYYVKEISPPVGYLADEAEHDLLCNYEGDLVATVERGCISPEQVKKQPFQLIKAADNGKTDADLLSGAGFTAYLLSSLDIKEDGSYDFDSASPVVLGENGATEIFTDDIGYACSIALPYGTYIVRETTTPHNYTPVDDFIVRITEHKPNTPQIWRVLLDDEFEAKLKITKQDDETKKAVLAKNTEFKIYNLDKKEYVEQVTTYPTTIVHKSYFTDDQGYLILPQNLKIGNYRIEEVQAPHGYTLNENYYEVAVDSNTAYQIDSVSGDAIIEVIYENHPVKGELRIVKQGEVLDGFKNDFIYETEQLSGAVFKVFAAEDIYTADFQKDSEGKRILEYASGELVATLTTDEKGKAKLSDLPLGTYKIVETVAPDGFVLNEEAQTVTFSYVDQNTAIIEQTAIFENDRQKVEISVVKKDAQTKKEVAGAVFGLYAKEDILAYGEVIIKADTLLVKSATGEDGKAVFNLDVPFGKYYIKETKAPAGYVSSDQVLDVTAEYQGQDVKVVYLSTEFLNEPTKIAVKKTDITTGVELSGARLKVIDKDGNVVDSWISVKGKEHLIERLTVGETYTLREELAPYGYLQAEEITFTVNDTAEVQKVEMKDDVPIGTLLISKKGEFLDKVSILDSIGGWIAHLFEYVTGSLKDVTFDVYASEDIKAADGESNDYYLKDELVATITTDETGYARLENLPLGKYYVKEKETAEGFVLDGEIREIDLTYRDQNTAEVTFSTDWLNNRQKVEVSVLKKEKDSDRVLEGAVFALYTKEDIKNKDGKVVMEADTLIEERATDQEGKLTFMADLPIGYSYYVKETAPAPGFATTDETQEFDFTYEDAETACVSYEFTFENEPTVSEFTKLSLTDEKEIEGAKLQVTDETGKVIEAWTSGKEPHIIKELIAGKTYTLSETHPADGYVTAEDIEFTVLDTKEVQKVAMKDDVTKVEISKTDIAGKELPGAKLVILDKEGKVIESWTSGEKPHYIEMLPIGEYTLHEEAAPEGYLVAEDVKFSVKDTGKIQKVVMKDEAKPADTPETPENATPSRSTPKTGDESNLLFWFIVMVLALSGCAGTMFLLGKKKKD